MPPTSALIPQPGAQQATQPTHVATPRAQQPSQPTSTVTSTSSIRFKKVAKKKTIWMP